MNHEKIDLNEKAAEPHEGQESIQGQIEAQEAKLQANVLRLQENVGRLPDDAEIKDEEIKAKVVEFKEMIQSNREDVMTKVGSIVGFFGLTGDALIGSLQKAGIANNFADSAFSMANLEQGAAYFTGMLAAGILSVAIDQVIKKIGTYVEGRGYEKNLREQTA